MRQYQGNNVQEESFIELLCLFTLIFAPISFYKNISTHKVCVTSNMIFRQDFFVAVEILSWLLNVQEIW